MSITEELEDKGIKIDSLTPDEKQTYFSMLKAVQDATLTPEKLRDYIHDMREAVTRDLIAEPEFTRFLFFKFENRKQILLKARLQNYVLLEAYLSSPNKAKKAFEDMIGAIKE